jgi:hypothetical protein
MSIGGFKDLSELHILATESDQPDMFDKVLDAAIWQAEHNHLFKSDTQGIGSESDLNKSKSKKKLTPEEEAELRSQLAEKYNYAYTEEAANRCLEWVKSIPEVALDIETYGRLKRDGLLYTRGIYTRAREDDPATPRRRDLVYRLRPRAGYGYD